MTAKKTVLLAGGAGYIGSHACLELLNAGCEVVIYDNFSNSHLEAPRRAQELSGKKATVVRGDTRDQAAVEAALREHGCDAVVHFAGLKAVGESMARPLAYYEQNVGGAVSLLKAMRAAGVRDIVFSSSSTVYGAPQRLPLTEAHPLAAVNPYGRTKLLIEDMLRDLHRAEPDWRVGILRYFNPVGAHESGLIGEDPRGAPENLMPFVAQVAAGRREQLNIWGDDYPTADGTGVRDYIHVVDLARGHLHALRQLDETGYFAVNLGAGRGYSVLEVVTAFERVSGRAVPRQVMPRRPGDVAECYADPSAAHTLLGWKAERGLETMCADMWNWQVKNPRGYA